MAIISRRKRSNGRGIWWWNAGDSRRNACIVGDAKKFIEPLRQQFKNVDVIPISELDLDSPTLRKR